jgi:Tfp pilus assembly protein PilX
MPFRRCASVFDDQRGVALPLALMVLMLLAALTVAFVALSATEPLIAANLRGGEQALALAEAGVERAFWALSNPTITGLTNLNAIPSAYNNGTLFALAGSASGAYAITISSGATPNTITASGYVLRNGVVVPTQPSQIVSTTIAAKRTVRVQATVGGLVGGPGAPSNQNLAAAFPGAVTVAGNMTMAGNSFADGNDKAAHTPNSCTNKGGVTVRNNGSDTITRQDSAASTDGTVGPEEVAYNPDDPKLAGSQKMGVDKFNKYLFTDAQLGALRALAQSLGPDHYIKPTSNSQLSVNVSNGLVFVDTVNAQPLGNPPDASKLANVKVSGSNTGGWLVVMGDVTIDGNVLLNGVYSGLIYALNSIAYSGTGNGAIYGATVAANVMGSTGTVANLSGNATVYYDCAGVANGGGTFSTDFQNELNRAIVSVVAGTWEEMEN